MPVAFFINFVTIRGPEYSYLNNECVTLLLNFQNVCTAAWLLPSVGQIFWIFPCHVNIFVTSHKTMPWPGQNGQNGIYFESLTNIYFIRPAPNMDKVRLFYCNKILHKFSFYGPKIQQGSHQKDSIRIMF